MDGFLSYCSVLPGPQATNAPAFFHEDIVYFACRNAWRRENPHSYGVARQEGGLETKGIKGRSVPPYIEELPACFHLTQKQYFLLIFACRCSILSPDEKNALQTSGNMYAATLLNCRNGSNLFYSFGAGIPD
jgi:hypothetical protein